MIPRFRSLALLPALLALPLAAQSTASDQTIIDRADQARPTPSLPAAEALPGTRSPGRDTDAGTQRVAEPRRLPFRLRATFDQQFTATDNVFLLPDDHTGALVSATTLALGIETLPIVVGTGKLQFSSTLAWTRNLHGLFTADPAIADLDFDSFSLPLAATYQWGQGWQATASFTVSSLYSVRGEPHYELLHRSLTPAFNLAKFTQLRPGLILNTSASISYSDTWASLNGIPAGLGFSNSRNDRTDASLATSLYLLRGPWTIVPGLRASYGHYLHWQEAGFNDQDRDELTLNADLSITYAFSPQAGLRLFAGYDIRESDSQVDYDYQSGSLGLGLAFGLSY